MRVWIIGMALGLAACSHNAATPGISPEVSGDGSTCEKPIVVEASSDRAATAWEYSWLSKHYPSHGPVDQTLAHGGGRSYDHLRFTDAKGEPASVCFDITRSVGR